MSLSTKKVSVRNGPLRLLCEWQGCGEVFYDSSIYYKHVEDHFVSHVSDANRMIKPGEHKCLWDLCEFVTTDCDDLLRHVWFHCYHTKVKWFGECVAKQEDLAKCEGTQNRNLIPDLPNGFECEWDGCNKVWDIPDLFYDHVYQVHGLGASMETLQTGEEVYRCQWKGCNYYHVRKPNVKPSLAKSKLKDHLRTHTKERMFACPDCGNLYVNKTKFMDHIFRQSDSKTHQYQCTHCSRTFATERLLKDHVRHHVNNYKCPLCEMTCPNPSAVKHHMKYKHSNNRPFKCMYCDYTAKTMYDLRTHVNFHKTHATFKCEVEGCNYKVRTQQNLDLHMRTKHNQPGAKWVCHICEAEYECGSKLTNHLIDVHKYMWPPGHTRFRYKLDKDGNNRLQSYRYESVNLIKTYEDFDPLKYISTQSVDEAPSIDIPRFQPGKSKIRKSKRYVKKDCNYDGNSNEKADHLANATRFTRKRKLLERENPESTRNIKTYELSTFQNNSPASHLPSITSQQAEVVKEEPQPITNDIDFSIVDVDNYSEGFHIGKPSPFMRIQNANENLLDNLQVENGPTSPYIYTEQPEHIDDEEFPQKRNLQSIDSSETRFLDLTQDLIQNEKESFSNEEENFSQEKDEYSQNQTTPHLPAIENIPTGEDESMKILLKDNNVMLTEDGAPLTVSINNVTYYVIKCSETSKSETFELMSSDQFQELIKNK